MVCQRKIIKTRLHARTDCSAVDVAVSKLDCIANGVSHLTRGRKPGAQTELWDGKAGVQGNRRDRHFQQMRDTTCKIPATRFLNIAFDGVAHARQWQQRRRQQEGRPAAGARFDRKRIAPPSEPRHTHTMTCDPPKRRVECTLKFGVVERCFLFSSLPTRIRLGALELGTWKWNSVLLSGILVLVTSV